MSGVDISVTGTITATTMTSPDGSFTLGTFDPCIGGFTVTPSKERYNFSPSSMTVTDPFAQRLGFTAIPNLVSFNPTARSVTEHLHFIRVTIRRTGNVSQGATVEYETVDGTATDRADYTGAFGTLRLTFAGFSAGALSPGGFPLTRRPSPPSALKTTANPTGAPPICFSPLPACAGARPSIQTRFSSY